MQGRRKAGEGWECKSQPWDLKGFLGWAWCLRHLWSEGSAGWCLLILICPLRHSVQDRGLQPPWEWQCDHEGEGDIVSERVALSVGEWHCQWQGDTSKGPQWLLPLGCLGALGTCVNTEKRLEHPPCAQRDAGGGGTFPWDTASMGLPLGFAKAESSSPCSLPSGCGV